MIKAQYSGIRGRVEHKNEALQDRNKDEDIENGLEDTGKGKGG